VANAAAAPTAELPSAADVHAWLDGDGDGCVTEAELRAAAEDRGIELTEEQVQAFMALEAEGVCVGLEAYLNSVDGSVVADLVAIEVVDWVEEDVLPDCSDGPLDDPDYCSPYAVS